METQITPRPAIRYNTDGTVASRTVYTNPSVNCMTKIVQVPTKDGGWWNITVERVRREVR